MIAKALVLLCVLSAAVSSDLDSIIEEIFGSTEPSAMAPTTEATIKTYDTCMKERNQEGVCVRYYRCKSKPTFEIDLHYQEQTCESYLDVCCAAADIIEPTPVPATTVTEATLEGQETGSI